MKLETQMMIIGFIFGFAIGVSLMMIVNTNKEINSHETEELYHDKEYYWY
jgi:hypothetical protein